MMAAPRYKWLIQGFSLCGQEKELHNFTLLKSVHTFIAYDDCVLDYSGYMKTNRNKFKTLCLPPKILACAPIVGDLTEFVNDILTTMTGFHGENSEETDFQHFDNGTHCKPIIMWDLYKRANCDCPGHRVLYSQSYMVFSTIQECVYNFAQCFHNLCDSETDSWMLFVHTSK